MAQKVKKCVDCILEGLDNKRKAPHPGPRCASHHRLKRDSRKSATWEQHIWNQYGLTTEEYWAIYNYQGGVCGLCRKANGKRKKLSVDHDHATGEIRGLYCSRCNNIFGHLRDDPEAFRRGSELLENPPVREVLGVRYVPADGAPVKGE